MSDEIEIERAIETDLPLLTSLLVELMGAMTDTKGFDINQSIKNLRSLFADPAQYIFVARQRNSILGFINFSTRKTIMHPKPSGLIDELVVSENSRGAGVGRELIRATINKCRELSCCEVEVSTEKSNRKARQFYKSCGFEEDAVLLELDLMDFDNH